MLHHLKGNAEQCLAEIGAGRSDRSAEAIGPGRNVATLGNDLHLVLVVGYNFGKFLLDIFAVLGLSANAREGVRSFIKPALLDIVTRRLGQEEQTGGQDDGPEKLNADGNTVGTRVVAVLGSVIDAVGEQDTDGYEELITRHDSPADFAWSDFGHIQDDDGGHEANASASDKTANNHKGESGRGDLHNDTNGEDNATCDDGAPSADEISNVTTDDGTEKGSRREDGRDE